MAKRPIPPAGEIVLYQTDDGQTRVECRFVEETLWLSQAFYTEGELDQAATIRKFRIVRREGSRRVAREVDHPVPPVGDGASSRVPREGLHAG